MSNVDFLALRAEAQGNLQNAMKGVDERHAERRASMDEQLEQVEF